jgi:hypothetical protein
LEGCLEQAQILAILNTGQYYSWFKRLTFETPFYPTIKQMPFCIRWTSRLLKSLEHPIPIAHFHFYQCSPDMYEARTSLKWSQSSFASQLNRRPSQ